MTEIPYVLPELDWFDARVLVHQGIRVIDTIVDLLWNAGQLEGSISGIFSEYLHLHRHETFGEKLCHLMLCRQIHREGARNDEMWFRVGKTDVKFGKLEFTLFTGLRFVPMPRHAVY
ncbi:hypothetical protein ACOSQ3_009955 [Xanthoceras sorbifolium]